jgi:protoporphyrinogen/coproporphyrinogen III oxidase
MVVNLWYPGQDFLAANHGFGYLIPTSTPNNEECALGVLFDSDITPQKTQHGEDAQPRGTQLTVMLGGHYWDNWAFLPDEQAGIEMAKAVVAKHLGIPPTSEVIVSARLCRDAIPQHFVGHRDRMARAHSELLDAFHGRLSVAGPSYGPIGVVPSMRAGFDAAMRVVRGGPQPWFRGKNSIPNVNDHVGQTGLQHFTTNEMENMSVMEKSHLPFRRWSRM